MKTTLNSSPGFEGYLTGLLLAVVLTSIPFAMVAWRLASPAVVATVIAVAGIMQVVVHLHYFLHLSFDAAARERSLILLFAVVLIAIMAGGTLLVMSDLNARML